MTSYTSEGLAGYRERGARKREAQGHKLEARVREWKTRDNTRAVLVAALEWQLVAEVLESCAYDIEKYYLGVSHTHEENLEHAKQPGVAGKHRDWKARLVKLQPKPALFVTAIDFIQH